MIIPNGTIETLLARPVEADPETGLARTGAEAAWSLPQPCQYTAESLDALRRTASGETAAAASYRVLTDDPPLHPGQGARVRLRDSLGRVVGEYSVKRTEPLEAVCQWRLWL